MNYNKINKIFRKELKDTFRDRSTILTVFVIPLLLYPALFIAAGFLLQNMEKEEQDLVPSIGIINIQKDSQLYNKLEGSDKIKIIDKDSLKTRLGKGEILLILEASGNVSGNIINEKPVPIVLFYDEANRLSIRAKNIVTEILTQYEKEIIEERLIKKNLDANVINAFTITEESITSSKKMSGFIVGILVPYLLIILLFTSSMNTAGDITAGEKERKTIDTLLVSNISRMEIVFGKMLTVIVVGLSSAIMGLAGLSISFYTGFSLLASMSSMKLSLSFVSLLFAFFMLIPISVLFSSLLLMIGSYSKSVKESTSYSTYVMIFVVLLAMVSVLRRGAESSSESFLIPVINTTLTQQELLINVVNWGHIGATILTTSILAAVTIGLSIACFLNEKILFRN